MRAGIPILARRECWCERERESRSEQGRNADASGNPDPKRAGTLIQVGERCKPQEVKIAPSFLTAPLEPFPTIRARSTILDEKEGCSLS